MGNNRDLIQQFYVSFQKKDYLGMQSCYHDEIIFSDPVFQNLQGKKAKAMWHMLIVAGKDLKLEFRVVDADEKCGRCHWEAWYTFSATGKKVHNIIEAAFEFQDRKIIRHNDHFDFWRWSRMALGASGILLGWSSFLKNKIRSRAQQNLVKFITAHPEYQ